MGAGCEAEDLDSGLVVPMCEVPLLPGKPNLAHGPVKEVVGSRLAVDVAVEMGLARPFQGEARDFKVNDRRARRQSRILGGADDCEGWCLSGSNCRDSED